MAETNHEEDDEDDKDGEDDEDDEDDEVAAERAAARTARAAAAAAARAPSLRRVSPHVGLQARCLPPLPRGWSAAYHPPSPRACLRCS